jgi:hypothetical protein
MGREWRKSAHGGDGNACVDVGHWRKSSYSGDGNECVEAGSVPGSVLIRDTDDLGSGPAQWARFTASVRR